MIFHTYSMDTFSVWQHQSDSCRSYNKIFRVWIFWLFSWKMLDKKNSSLLRSGNIGILRPCLHKRHNLLYLLRPLMASLMPFSYLLSDMVMLVMMVIEAIASKRVNYLNFDGRFSKLKGFQLKHKNVFGRFFLFLLLSLRILVNTKCLLQRTFLCGSS